MVWGLRLKKCDRRVLLNPKQTVEAWQWVTQCAIAGPPLTTTVPVSQAYACYCGWSDGQKGIAGLKRFVKEIRALGFDCRRRASGPVIYGICLKD